ncbi:SnoaL-like polyketide cyclase [Halovenus aranensis]|uniref:histidine kinase n=1 Tax=Halovenus aranensis TaxID=890420 RepID=A0A1G8UNP4_9EURY|nr:SnoaL-like polyketide cyclase [Halovenus aranensis]
MVVSEKVRIVHEYINVANESSRVAAATQFLSEDATVIINGERLSRSEYIALIEESDRTFVPEQMTVEQTVVQGDQVAIRATATLDQIDSAYGVEPTDDAIEQPYAVFHRIVDGEIVELAIVVDEISKFRQLGLLSEDPTKEQLQDQYYQVLNRVLRHDLRNRLNVIRLTADSLADGDVEDSEVAGVKIRSVVDELLQTTDKARALEQLAIDTPLEPTTFSLDSLVEPILEAYNERTDVSCSASYPDEIPTVTTDKKLLWNALNELLENAVVYTDGAEPEVTVAVQTPEQSRHACALSVEDNGSEIPSEVLKPITENSETKLLHGNGIGLWIVKWCLTRLDGELSFDQSGDGTRVNILLPDLE